MSITVQHTVWCDGCAHWYQMTGTARDVLKMAKRDGWRRTHTGGVVRDLCAGCFKIEREKKP